MSCGLQNTRQKSKQLVKVGSSRLQVFCRVDGLKKNFKITEKYPQQSVFLSILQAQVCNFTQKVLHCTCFPVNFLKLFSKAILQMISLPLPLSTELACLFKTPDFEDSNLSSILCPLGSRFAFSTSTTRKRGSNFFCTYSSSPKLMQGGVKTLGLETFFVITSLRYIPADTDVFNTSSERLKKVTTSYNQIRRCQAVWKKTSDLRRLEHVLFTSP